MQNLSTEGGLSKEEKGWRRGDLKEKGRRKCEGKCKRLKLLIKDQPCGEVSFAWWVQESEGEIVKLLDFLVY